MRGLLDSKFGEKGYSGRRVLDQSERLLKKQSGATFRLFSFRNRHRGGSTTTTRVVNQRGAFQVCPTRLGAALKEAEDVAVELVPSISVIIPTYNSERTISQCLTSLSKQDYPKDKIEVIVVDGGSRDNTLEIVRKYGVDKIVHNPLRTGEAGKSAGVGASRNTILLFQDSDNILSEPNWLNRMVRPFRDGSIIGAEPLYYTYRSKDPFVTRYCSLLGMNDPICLYLGNYDRYSYVTGKWTELLVKVRSYDDYLLVELERNNVPTIGANGFLVRADAMKKIRYEPYLFDVDVVRQLVEIGNNRIAKVKIGIVHLYADNLTLFARKTRRRIRDYLFYEKRGVRNYPWRSTHMKVLRFVLFTMLIFPVVRDALRGYRNKPEAAWLFHPLASWITLLTYGLEYVGNG